jgi:hypothetical protein
MLNETKRIIDTIDFELNRMTNRSAKIVVLKTLQRFINDEIEAISVS